MRNPAFKVGGIKKKATSYETQSEEVIFTLYKTPIVRIRKHDIWLQTGGYNTVITKRRMNEISKEFNLGYVVYSDKGIWHVQYRGKHGPMSMDKYGYIARLMK